MSLLPLAFDLVADRVAFDLVADEGKPGRMRGNNVMVTERAV
jgi:hypothetical protein